MSILSKIFSRENKEQHENTDYSGMWVCPNCNIALTTEAVTKLRGLSAWFCCPGCGYNHQEQTYKEKVNEAKDE